MSNCQVRPTEKEKEHKSRYIFYYLSSKTNNFNFTYWFFRIIQKQNQNKEMLSIIQGFGRVLSPKLRFLCLSQTKPPLGYDLFRRSLHIIQSIGAVSNTTSLEYDQKNASILSPVQNIQYMQTRGLKHVGKVHRLCKDCHMMLREGVMYNYCKLHPKHNQKARTKRPKNTWILTGVTTGTIRSW